MTRANLGKLDTGCVLVEGASKMISREEAQSTLEATQVGWILNEFFDDVWLDAYWMNVLVMNGSMNNERMY